MEKQELYAEIKRRLLDAYGDRLKGVILYGSEARGEAHEDSDIDVMVLLEGPVKLWDEIKRSVHAVYPLTLESGRPVSPDPVDVRDYEAGEFAFYRNVRREGIPL